AFAANVFAEQQALKNRLQYLLALHWDGDGDAKRTANAAMLADQDIQYKAINLVINAIIRYYTHHFFWLSVAINTSLTLFMSCRIPRKIIVKDSIKRFL